jgi:pyruvate dehydrogenase E2 component (dihydrolipoamide acetyltransferase)
VKRDIDWYKPSGFVQGSSFGSAAVLEESWEEFSISQMRKTIAKRLSESKFTSPHFYLTMDIDMEEAMKARESINLVTGQSISYNDLVIKASATSLRQNPKINASWMGESIRLNHHIHIGVAVAVEDGLLVPVVRFADSKTLTHIHSEVKDLAQKAKDKKLQPADWEGNTFTISNLGMFDIEEFTAIINPPDACIMAIGAIKATPVVKNGNVIAGHMMRVTLSCDHRIVDGVTGAKFLQTFKGLMENPVILLGQASI